MLLWIFLTADRGGKVCKILPAEGKYSAMRVEHKASSLLFSS